MVYCGLAQLYLLRLRHYTVVPSLGGRGGLQLVEREVLVEERRAEARLEREHHPLVPLPLQPAAELDERRGRRRVGRVARDVPLVHLDEGLVHPGVRLVPA